LLVIGDQDSAAFNGGGSDDRVGELQAMLRA
jgi:hypothetical protein